MHLKRTLSKLLHLKGYDGGGSDNLVVIRHTLLTIMKAGEHDNRASLLERRDAEDCAQGDLQGHENTSQLLHLANVILKLTESNALLLSNLHH